MQFTMETSDTQLPLLDIMINKEEKEIFMDIYLKPTDSKIFVSFKSNHLKNCLKNIPFYLARRICMIIEKDHLKEIKLKEIETLLLELLYPERIIKAGINKTLKTPPKGLKSVKEQEKKKILPFMSTFNLNNQNFGSNEKRFKKVKFINYKRQAPNLSIGRILCQEFFFIQ